MAATPAAPSEIPARCPVCSTDIPPGRNRCHGCGKVFGEDNRCPHCLAVAPVLRTGQGAICSACSKPRDTKPGTVIIGDAPAIVGLVGAKGSGAAIAARAGGGGLRIFGAMLIGAGVLAAAAMAVLFPGAIGIALAILAGGTSVGLGALALKGGAKAGAHADRTERTERQLRIMELAEKSSGDLTATEVARAMKMSLEEADAALTAMADGSRVAVEIDENGIVHYVFRELSAGQASSRKVRVPTDAGASEGEAAEVEAAASTPAAQEAKRRAE